MIEQQELGRVNDAASWFEAFIVAHPVVVSIFLAWFVSWVVTAALKKPLRAWVNNDWQDWVVRTFDCLVATSVCVQTWPNDHAAWWALAIGFGSPFAYFAVSELLCLWKPGLRKYLTLGELATPLPPPVVQPPAPPGDTQ